MVYFLGLRLGFSGSASGFAFGGRPLPGTLRMASRADFGYMASFVVGFIFATKRRWTTVLRSIPSSAAISVIVKPSIRPNITYSEKKINKYTKKIRFRLDKI